MLLEIGTNALRNQTTGWENMAIGYKAGHGIGYPTKGYENVSIGKPKSNSLTAIAKNQIKSAITAVQQAALLKKNQK